MTDGDAWEAHCAAKEGPPYVCADCGAAFDPTDEGEIDAHRDDHWFDFLRSQCPIPPPSRPAPPLPIYVQPDEDVEVPF